MAVPEDVKDDWKKAVLDCMNNLHPFLRQTLPYCDSDKKSLEELQADLHRLKKEKFPEEIKREKEMAKYVKEILKELDSE